MSTKFSLISLLAGTLFFSACGEGSIDDKKFLIILKSLKEGICESQEYRDTLEPSFSNLITKEEPNSITCSSYGRDSTTCKESDYEGAYGKGDKACVVGFDSLKQNKFQKINSLNDTDALDIIQSAYIKIAE